VPYALHDATTHRCAQMSRRMYVNVDACVRACTSVCVHVGRPGRVRGVGGGMCACYEPRDTRGVPLAKPCSSTHALHSSLLEM
jgi:hypothetical protein